MATNDYEFMTRWRVRGTAAEVYDWRLRAEKPLLRYLSSLFKPFFCANHRWAMARGERVCKRNYLGVLQYRYSDSDTIERKSDRLGNVDRKLKIKLDQRRLIFVSHSG
jgi:hypothetical protein